jgi:hypothetical protein
MKLNLSYEDIDIEASDLITYLETYAKAILFRMQKADDEYKECWTGCSITFDGVSPQFFYGSIEDVKDDGGIIVGLPLTA